MSSTRLLILGALRLLQPAHGYSIRKQLEAWQADEWANVAFGSIYFALRTMEQDGLVRTVTAETPPQRAGRIPYVLTDRGEQEYHRLLDEEWARRKPIADPFLAGLAFMSSLPPDRLLGYLQGRRDAALREADELERNSRAATPRHVAELSLLTAARLRAEARWAEAAMAKVERDELP